MLPYAAAASRLAPFRLIRFDSWLSSYARIDMSLLYVAADFDFGSAFSPADAATPPPFAFCCRLPPSPQRDSMLYFTCRRRYEFSMIRFHTDCSLCFSRYDFHACRHAIDTFSLPPPPRHAAFAADMPPPCRSAVDAADTPPYFADTMLMMPRRMLMLCRHDLPLDVLHAPVFRCMRLPPAIDDAMPARAYDVFRFRCC